MAITFVEKATVGGGSAANAVVAAPAGLADNDIMLFWIYKENTAAVTWPSGFTEILSIAASDSSFAAYLAWKRAASESGNYTASWTGSVWRDGSIVAYRGCLASGDPQSGTAQAQANGSTNTPTTPTMTTAHNNAMVVALCCNYQGYSAGSPPAGMTERVDFDDTGIADVIQASAGATGTKQFTAAYNGQSVGAIMALQESLAFRSAWAINSNVVIRG